MVVNSFLSIVESRVMAYLKGLGVGNLNIDNGLHTDLDLECKCHASLSRPDLVLVTRSISSYSYSYSYSYYWKQVFSGLVRRTDVV